MFIYGRKKIIVEDHSTDITTLQKISCFYNVHQIETYKKYVKIKG